jgi:hypothetical protein
MFSACANPDCRVPFDYHGGRLFRFHKAHREDDSPLNTHSVQHFWLCTDCSAKLILDYQDGLGVMMSHRRDLTRDAKDCRLIAAA